MRDEQFRDVELFVEDARHPRLLDADKTTIGHRGCGRDAQRLTCQASLAEEITGVQNGNDRLLALLGCNRDLHLAASDVEHRIRRFPLPEDLAVRAVFYSGFPGADSSEDGFPIDSLAFLTWHNNRS